MQNEKNIQKNKHKKITWLCVRMYIITIEDQADLYKQILAVVGYVC